MTWEDIKQQILNDKDNIVTWEQVRELVGRDKEDEERKNEEIRQHDAETAKRLEEKSKFVSNDSIRFTRDEYDKLKSAFCISKGWGLERPHTVNVSSITLKGSYKWMPSTDIEFHIKVED